jgi:hypothetical protein
MKQRKPNAINRELLLYLKAYPDGLSATTLAAYAKTKFYLVYPHLKRLEKAGFIAAKDRFWTLLPAGQNWLLTVLNAPSQLSTTAPLTVSKPSLPPKRLNGMRVYFRVYRTEHERLEAKLTAAGIAFTPERARHYLQYFITWQGYKLRFTTRTLVVYVPEQYTGFEIEGKAMVNEAADKACRAVVALLARLPVRMLEENGKLWHRIAYFEIAHTHSEAAKAIMKQVRRTNTVPLAFDKMSGLRCTWADNSYNLSELEFSKLLPEALNATMQQDLKDGRWNHRVEQEKLRQALETVSQLVKAQGLTAQALQGNNDGLQAVQRNQVALLTTIEVLARQLTQTLADMQDRQRPKRWEYT